MGGGLVLVLVVLRCCWVC